MNDAKTFRHDSQIIPNPYRTNSPQDDLVASVSLFLTLSIIVYMMIQ